MLSETSKPFSASDWHRQRRRDILADHGTEALVHSPDASLLENAFAVCGIGSLRANWAIYCGHAISHGRWSKQLGRFGGARFNAALAVAHIGHVFQVLPNYWLFHHSHHTKLGALSLTEARSRAKQCRPTDGDIAIATRIFSPPARRYTLFLEEPTATEEEEEAASTTAANGVVDKPRRDLLPRQDEVAHQLLSVVVHAFTPAILVGYLAAAVRAGEGAEQSLQRSACLQAAAQVCGFLGVAALSLSAHSASPLEIYLLSSAFWLSPLNPNSLWTSPHISKPGATQPTVSFYTPSNAFGALLDGYMGWENYHVEHHDFPEMPMYLLPRLREIAPEHYEPLHAYRVCDAESWREVVEGEFFYACQDRRFAAVGGREGKEAAAPVRGSSVAVRVE